MKQLTAHCEDIKRVTRLIVYMCDLSASQVHGKSGNYLTLPTSYCACQAHYYEVVSKSEAPYVSATGHKLLEHYVPCAYYSAAVVSNAFAFLPADPNCFCCSTSYAICRQATILTSLQAQGRQPAGHAVVWR
jgi:hypothetical protein